MGEHWSYDWVVSDKDWVSVGDVWDWETRVADLEPEVLMGYSSPQY